MNPNSLDIVSLFVKLHHDAVDTIAIVVVDIVAKLVDKQKGEITASQQGFGTGRALTQWATGLAAILDKELITFAAKLRKTSALS